MNDWVNVPWWLAQPLPIKQPSLCRRASLPPAAPHLQPVLPPPLPCLPGLAPFGLHTVSSDTTLSILDPILAAPQTRIPLGSSNSIYLSACHPTFPPYLLTFRHFVLPLLVPSCVLPFLWFFVAHILTHALPHHRLAPPHYCYLTFLYYLYSPTTTYCALFSVAGNTP